MFQGTSVPEAEVLNDIDEEHVQEQGVDENIFVHAEELGGRHGAVRVECP